MQLEIQQQAVGANQHIAQSEMVLAPPVQPGRKIPDISPLTGPPGKGQRRAFSRRAAKRGRAAGNLERRSPELTGIPFRALIATLPPKSPLDSSLLMMEAIIRARQMVVKTWASTRLQSEGKSGRGTLRTFTWNLLLSKMSLTLMATEDGLPQMRQYLKRIVSGDLLGRFSKNLFNRWSSWQLS